MDLHISGSHGRLRRTPDGARVAGNALHVRLIVRDGVFGTTDGPDLEQGVLREEVGVAALQLGLEVR